MDTGLGILDTGCVRPQDGESEGATAHPVATGGAGRAVLIDRVVSESLLGSLDGLVEGGDGIIVHRIFFHFVNIQDDQPGDGLDDAHDSCNVAGVLGDPSKVLSAMCLR